MNKDRFSQDTAVVNLLSAYFAQRGKFLAQVILADLVNSPYLPTKQQSSLTHELSTNSRQSTNGMTATVAKQTVVAPTNSNDQQTVPALMNGSSQQQVADTVPISQPQNLSERSSAVIDANANDADGIAAEPDGLIHKTSIQDILIERVIEQTGFPANSFSPDARLLDDLNLDSIKSAELVAQVAKGMGIEGQVDPSTFANASLAEVATALEKLAGLDSEVRTQTVTAAAPATSTTKGESKSLVASTSAMPVEEKEVAPWVRNFIVEYVPEEDGTLSFKEGWQNTNLFAIDNWKTANILIVTAEPDVKLVNVLSQQLSQRGAMVQTIGFAEMDERSMIKSTEFTHFMAVMPQAEQVDMTVSDRLRQSMEQMYAIATPPQASKANREYTSITYIQFGGGYFGKQGELNHIDRGCLIGFSSTVHIERPDLKVRVIDIPRENATLPLIDRMLEDIARPDGYLTVGYDTQLTRRVPRPVIQDRTQYQKRNIVWTDEDVVLVTGGAKGITAECAFAFAQVANVKMALVGSSAHPQDDPTGKSASEISRTLRRFKKEGLTCNYYACDVANLKATKALVQKVEADLGKVTGVIHGAAINRAKRAEDCPVDRVLPEISPKVMGMFNLCDILQDCPPKMFVGISSIAATIGLPGNSWYSYSNEVLDLLLRRFRKQHSETEVFSVAYSVWADVGMGARMGTVKNLGRMGIKAIPSQEGIDRFVQLMFFYPGDDQVVITASLGGIQTLGRGFDTWRVKRPSPPAEYRFIETPQLIDPGIEIVSQTHLTLERDSYVRDHIYKGTYLFPTVFGLEAMAQMVAYITGQRQFKTIVIEDIRLERPIVVDPKNGVTIELRANMPERESTHVPQQVKVEIRTEQTGFAKAHFAATFVLCDEKATEVEPIQTPIQPLGLNPHNELYGDLLWQGDRFRRLQNIDSLDADRMIFTTQRGVEPIKAGQPFDRADGPFLLGDPYCRDSLLQSVQPMVPQDVGLPIGIKRIELQQPSTQPLQCLGLVRGQGHDGRNYSSSVLLTDAQGHVLEKIEGYQVRKVEHRPENPTVEELISNHREKNPSVAQISTTGSSNSVFSKTNQPLQGNVADTDTEQTANANESDDANNLDEKQLREELRSRAELLNVDIPKISLEDMPGLHKLSTEERHEKEIQIFRRTVNLCLGLLVVSLCITGAFVGTF